MEDVFFVGHTFVVHSDLLRTNHMIMKQKILTALKTKYANKGFGEKALDGVADFLSKTVTKEEDIEAAVSGIESMLTSFQSETDRLRTENATLKKEVEDKKKADEPGKKTETKDDDIQKMVTAAVEAAVKPLLEKLAKQEAAAAAAARQQLILSKAKELKIPQERIDEGFAIAEDADEAGITTYLTKVAQREVARGLDQKEGNPLSTNDKLLGEVVEASLVGLPKATE